MRVAEQSPRSCPDNAVPQEWLRRFWRANPGDAARPHATRERSRPGVYPLAGRIRTCTTSPKRAICFRLRVRDCLEKKTEGTSGFVSILRPFDTLRQAQGPDSRHRRLRTPQAQRTWGREGPELFGGFRIGGTRDTSRGNFQDRLVWKPLFLAPLPTILCQPLFLKRCIHSFVELRPILYVQV